MTILDGQRVIAIEEHYSDPEVTALFEGIDGKLFLGHFELLKAH